MPALNSNKTLKDRPAHPGIPGNKPPHLTHRRRRSAARLEPRPSPRTIDLAPAVRTRPRLAAHRAGPWMGQSVLAHLYLHFRAKTLDDDSSIAFSSRAPRPSRPGDLCSGPLAPTGRARPPICQRIISQRQEIEPQSTRSGGLPATEESLWHNRPMAYNETGRSARPAALPPEEVPPSGGRNGFPANMYRSPAETLCRRSRMPSRRHHTACA